MAKLGVVLHYLLHQLLDHCCRIMPSCWLVSSAAVFAIASMTSSASPVSTLSEPAVAGYSAKKSSISSTI
jgi:hypothetical protein